MGWYSNLYSVIQYENDILSRHHLDIKSVVTSLRNEIGGLSQEYKIDGNTVWVSIEIKSGTYRTDINEILIDLFNNCILENKIIGFYLKYAEIECRFLTDFTPNIGSLETVRYIDDLYESEENESYYEEIDSDEKHCKTYPILKMFIDINKKYISNENEEEKF